MYQELAKVYDETGQVEFNQRFFAYLKELLPKHHFNGKQILDLACGTGILSLLMARYSYLVTGVDASEEMLEQAKNKASKEGLPIELFRQDMRDLKLSKTFDLAVCVGAIYYLLTHNGLTACFEQVAKVLKPEGLFIFETYTQYFVEKVWPTLNPTLQRGNITTYAQPIFYNIKEHIQQFKIITKENNASGEKITEEEHFYRIFTPEQIRESLSKAGLKLEAEYDCFTFDEPSDNSEKVVYVTRKK
jgi:2-polyprenyl-3-methyl-5-hydroxy-6-metoxy-1,4-benzoquinol methylase